MVEELPNTYTSEFDSDSNMLDRVMGNSGWKRIMKENTMVVPEKKWHYLVGTLKTSMSISCRDYRVDEKDGATQDLNEVTCKACVGQSISDERSRINRARATIDHSENLIKESCKDIKAANIHIAQFEERLKELDKCQSTSTAEKPQENSVQDSVETA